MHQILVKLFGENLPKKIFWFWGTGLLLRLIAIGFAGSAPDFVGYRLPIAECLNSGSWLYCECAYNHTPFYPYLSAAMYWLAGTSNFLQVFLINLPLALGDAIVPLLIFILFKKWKDVDFALKASVIYALNPISIIEVGISHWDGFTVMFLLLGSISIYNDQTAKAGAWTGMGFLLKQFPLLLLPVILLKTRRLKTTFIAGMVTLIVIMLFFLPFIIRCPETFVQNLLNHPLWKGAASEGVGIGTIKNVFNHLQVPYAKFIWGFIFLFLMALPSFKVNKHNHVYYTGILTVVLAFFTFVTHRQLLLWCMPFIILITLERKAYLPFILLFIGYAIRIIKPDWYFGFIHLGVGVWYYIVLLKELTKIYATTTDATKWRL